MNKKRGFTVIELLVTVLLVGLMAVIANSVLFTYLKVRRKNESVSKIKQSGEYALSVLRTRIRNADEVTSWSSDSLQILNEDGNTSTFCCGGSGDCAAVCPGMIAFDNYCLTSDKLVLSNCAFDYNDPGQPGIPATIAVEFTLSKGSPSDILDYATQTFKTTISLRTY